MSTDQSRTGTATTSIHLQRSYSWSQFGWTLGIGIFIVVLDQLTKIWALNSLESNGVAKNFIGEFIQLRLVYNSGAAFSLGQELTALLTFLAFVAVVGVVTVSGRLTTRLWMIAGALIWGGAAGNLIDRLFRAPGFPTGHVVDFIDYGPFIGNVADIAIFLAAVLVIILALQGSPALLKKK